MSTPARTIRHVARDITARAMLRALLVVAVACADPAADTASDVPQYELVEVTTISGANDEGPETFARIAGAGVLPDNRIVVLDNVYHEVRLFSSDGEFLSTAGREGSGPGELRQPFGLGVAPDGIIWVRDNGNGRYVRFAVRGDSLIATSTLALSEGAQGPGLSPSFDNSGRLIHLGLGASAPGGEMMLTRFTVSADGRDIVSRAPIIEPPPDSIGQYAVPMGNGGTRYFYQPYAPSFLQAHANGGDWARAVSSVATVERYDAAGVLKHRVTVTPAPVALSPAEQAGADSTITRTREMAGRELPFSVPAYKQPLRGIYFDHAGRLWVEHSVPEGARRVADVFDASGVLFGRVTWPAAISVGVGAIGEEVIVGVVRDELDVQRVVVMRIQAVGEGRP